MTAAVNRPPHRIGWYLAVVQFFLALGWVVYATYLPQLAKAAGLQATWVPWLLMADQLVFLLTDLAVGLASDRAAKVLGRIGYAVLAATLLSSLAFLALPLVAKQGSPLLFVGVTFVWAITSSALRAPPLTLLGRYVAKPALPVMVALSSFGVGVAGALAPFVGLRLKSVDPTLPFVVSALSLAAVTLGMVAAERALARHSAGQAATLEQPQPIRWAPTLFFLAACALGATAFQWHGFVASAPLALRFATAAELPSLLPAFWVGFNLALVPAGLLAKRTGPLRALVLGAALAAAGNAAAAFAPTLSVLLGAQLLTGVGWALLLCSAFAAALEIGKGTRAGLMGGALSATLAFAALARIAYVSQSGQAPALGAQLAVWAAAGFVACGVLAWLLRRRLATAGI